MSWAKIDDRFYGHPKAQAAGLEGIGLWTLTLSHSCSYGTNGHVRRATAQQLAGSPEAIERVAAVLVAAGLWEPHESGDGWQIHDFLDYNPSAKDAARLRRDRARAGQAGGKRRASNALAESKQLLEQTPGNAEAKSNPDPDPDPVPDPPTCVGSPAHARELDDRTSGRSPGRRAGSHGRVELVSAPRESAPCVGASVDAAPVLTFERTQAAEMVGVRDIDLVWVKFIGHGGWKTCPDVDGAWAKWFGQEAQFQRQARDRASERQERSEGDGARHPSRNNLDFIDGPSVRKAAS